MMPSGGSYSSDWLRIAERDLGRAERLLRDPDPDAELAAVCLQHAAEKFLKAFLLSKGWPWRKIHDVEALLDDAVAYEPSLERFRRPCEAVAKYYALNRCPMSASFDMRAADVLAVLENLRGLFAFVRAAAPPPKS